MKLPVQKSRYRTEFRIHNYKIHVFVDASHYQVIESIQVILTYLSAIRKYTLLIMYTPTEHWFLLFSWLLRWLESGSRTHHYVFISFWQNRENSFVGVNQTWIDRVRFKRFPKNKYAK